MWGILFFNTEVTLSNALAFESVKCVNILFDQVTPAAVKSEFSRSVKGKRTDDRNGGMDQDGT